MIVTRTCHRCGKRNQFDDDKKVDGDVRCTRCKGRIRRTKSRKEKGLAASVSTDSLWGTLKALYVRYKTALNAGLAVAVLIGMATYVFTRPAPVAPTGDLGLPVSVAGPTKTAVRVADLPKPKPPVREPRRFESEPVWDNLRSVRNLPFPLTGSPLVSAAGSPLTHIAVDGTIYEVASGQSHGRFDVTGAMATAVSADGNWFAMGSTNADGEFGVFLHPARNRSLAPVRLELDVPAERLGVMMFLPDNRLLVQSRLVVGSKVSLWETSGRLADEFETPSFDSDSCALSPDGTHFALVSALSVDVYEVESGGRVAMMASVETGFPTSMCSGLAFSPDGQELAALLHMDRFIVWKVKGGEVQLVHTLGQRLTEQTASDHAIQWVPDGSGWLLYGSMLLLSDPVCVAWQTEPPRGRGYLVDRGHVLVEEETATGPVLAPVALPWDEIEELDEVLRSPLLGVGREISVRLETERDDREARIVLTKALTSRCEAVGFKIKSDASVRLVMKYSERQGTRTLLAGDENLDDKDQVARPIELKCRFRLEHLATGRTLWSRDLRTDGGPTPLEATSTQALHIRAIEALLAHIENLNLPSCIPDQSVRELPLKHRVSTSAEEASDNRR